MIIEFWKHLYDMSISFASLSELNLCILYCLINEKGCGLEIAWHLKQSFRLCLKSLKQPTSDFSLLVKYRCWFSFDVNFVFKNDCQLFSSFTRTFLKKIVKLLYKLKLSFWWAKKLRLELKNISENNESDVCNCFTDSVFYINSLITQNKFNTIFLSDPHQKITQLKNILRRKCFPIPKIDMKYLSIRVYLEHAVFWTRVDFIINSGPSQDFDSTADTKIHFRSFRERSYQTE